MSAAALWTQHREIAYKVASEFYLPGSERQDVEQEALIGLWIAARTYLPERGQFRAFAFVVIRRRLTSLLRAAGRQRADVLTGAARVTDDGQVIVDTLTGPDLERVVVDREAFRRLVAAFHKLTPLEHAAIVALLNGEPQDKQHDNAATRARRKLRDAA